MLSQDDIRNRLASFSDKVEKKVGQSFWSYTISFYIDGTGFVYKRNSKNQTCAPKVKEWRRPNEGRSYGCSENGRSSNQLKPGS